MKINQVSSVNLKGSVRKTAKSTSASAIAHSTTFSSSRGLLTFICSLFIPPVAGGAICPPSIPLKGNDEPLYNSDNNVQNKEEKEN